jgi:hypothetical protein
MIFRNVVLTLGVMFSMGCAAATQPVDSVETQVHSIRSWTVFPGTPGYKEMAIWMSDRQASLPVQAQAMTKAPSSAVSFHVTYATRSAPGALGTPRHLPVSGAPGEEVTVTSCYLLEKTIETVVYGWQPNVDSPGPGTWAVIKLTTNYNRKMSACPKQQGLPA